MIVVLDTNVFIPHTFHLEGVDFETLRRAAKRLDIRILIPAPVVEEVARNFRKNLEEEWRTATNTLRDPTRLAGELEQIPDLHSLSDEFLGGIQQRYREEFNRRLNELEAEVRRYPAVTHRQIMQRLAARRKPFKENGQGYADTLIWETILEVAREQNQTVCFVSNNSRDFLVRDGNTLADDLLQDLPQQGIAPERVQIYNLLRDFIAAHVRERLTALDEILGQINQGEHPFVAIIRAAFPAQIPDFEANLIERGRESLPWSRQVDDFTVNNIEPELSSFRATDVRQLDDTHIRLDICATFGVTFDFFVDRGDVWEWEDSDRGIEIWDSNWNEWYAWAAYPCQISSEFSIIINSESQQIESFSIGDATIVALE